MGLLGAEVPTLSPQSFIAVSFSSKFHTPGIDTLVALDWDWCKDHEGDIIVNRVCSIPQLCRLQRYNVGADQPCLHEITSVMAT